MGGGAWPFLVGGAICLVNSDNERDSSLLNSLLTGRPLDSTLGCLPIALTELRDLRVTYSWCQSIYIYIIMTGHTSGSGSRRQPVSVAAELRAAKFSGLVVKMEDQRHKWQDRPMHVLIDGRTRHGRSVASS